MFFNTSLGQTAGRILLLTVAAIAGCAVDGPHIGLTVSDTNEGTKFTDAGGRESMSPATSAATGRVVPVPVLATLLVARVDSIDAGAAGFAVETVPADQRAAFREHATAKRAVASATFADPPSDGSLMTAAQLRKHAVDGGARLLLIYEHKTPQKESGILIYKVDFDSKARGILYNTATGRAVSRLSGAALGTLGGLTPLQMTVHPQVEPQTKRMAVEKLADALSDTVIARPDLVSEAASSR